MINATASKRRKAKADRVVYLPIDSICPSPENDRLYRPVDPDDPEIITLAQSIREHGVQEPLALSRDGYVISGHRRLVAARLAGLDTLPCLVRDDVSRADDRDGFLRLLRECNRQRTKSFAEKVREEVVSANPEEAYASLIVHRDEAANSDLSGFRCVDLGETKTRCAISKAKGAFLDAVQRVLEDRRAFWPVSDRQIHYALLNSPPLVNARRPGSRYANNPRSYKALSDLLTRARLAGLVPFEAIADETRPVSVCNVCHDVQGFVRDQLDGLLKDYWRDLLQSQPNHIELVAEKNTLASILRPVAMKYCLPFTSGRGYCSLPPRKAMADRFTKSGKEKLVLLMVSDFDPDGETIAQSFARSMRDDFGIDTVEAVKVALTAEQVERFHLPPGLKAKAGCKTRKRFVDQYGEHVHEVEALPPEELQRITCEAIDAALDREAFNHELDEEEREAGYLEGVRRAILDTVKDTVVDL